MSNQIKLITSGAYVDQELVAEFGRIPPAFLSIGVRRLYEAQVPSMGGGPIYLTLPEKFAPDATDLSRLDKLGVKILAVPENISLAESIIYALVSIAEPGQSLMILHGDTLIEDTMSFQSGLNCIGVQSEGHDYSWAAISKDGDRVKAVNEIEAGSIAHKTSDVVCGIFSFSDAYTLIKALVRSRGDFIRGLNLFAAENDVRAVSISQWNDFGHLQTYFSSRRMITTARAFNTLYIDNKIARKSSADNDKMRAEAEWLRTVPADIQPYSARLLSTDLNQDISSYTTEYAYAPTLAELYVFGNLGEKSWARIINSCKEFLETCTRFSSDSGSDTTLARLVGDKTVIRLEQYSQSKQISIDRPLRYNDRAVPSLIEIADIVSERVREAPVRRENIMHGDFCFSNILYNSRTERILVIDPRGYTEAGKPSPFGDTRYDLAKLAHSIFGRYDHILAGRFTASQHGNQFSISFADNEAVTWLNDMFRLLVVDGISACDEIVMAMTISLFLSMLPLHSDRPDRQIAFVANALRLFCDLDRSAQ